VIYGVLKYKEIFFKKTTICFKRKYLKPKFITVFGNEIKIPNTTSELNKSDFVEYLGKICSESGVALPDPNELEGYIPN
jgi:hypothetical protein